MRCPYCGFLDSKVIDKRETSDLSSTKRRRECLGCHKRFNTHERVEAVDILIVKKDGRREAFNPEKLRTGLFKALEKRPFGDEEIEQVIVEIEAELRAYKSTEIPSKQIGEMVMKKLKSLDKISYIRFASVYKNFTEVADFEAALKSLVPERGKLNDYANKKA
jgi:transcriptional repressor NrdR